MLWRIRRIEAHRDTPVLVVTAFDELDIRLEALQAGATDFLSKPVNAVEFRARFANIAERRRAEIALRNRAEWLQQGIEPTSASWLSVRVQSATISCSRQAGNVRRIAVGPAANTAEACRSRLERSEDKNFLDQDTRLLSVLTNARHPNTLRCRRGRRRPQFGNEPQDVGEEVSRDRDLGHLEGDIAAVADDLRADLDQLLLQARQRPILDRLGRGEGA